MAANETRLSDLVNDTSYGNNVTTKSVTTTVLEYVVVVELLFSSLAMVCNIFTCCIFKVLRVKWNARLKLIFSLCVADFFVAETQFVQGVCGFNSPITNYLIQVNEHKNFTIYNGDGGLAMWIVNLVQVGVYNNAQIVQQITMMCLAVDILIAVKNPLRYSQRMSSKIGTILVTFIWGFAIVYTFFGETSSADYSGLPLLSLLVIPLITLVFIVTIYLVTFCEIRKLRDRSPRTLSLKKSALTFSLIVLTYVTCMMPIAWLLIAYFVFNVHYLLLTDWIQIFKCLLAFNAACDPIIYAYRMRELNPIFRKMFKKCSCGHPT